jgi:hypothetical protein
MCCVFCFALVLKNRNNGLLTQLTLLVEIKWKNVGHNTTVFSNCWRKQLHVSAEKCSCFLQQFENTVVLRRIFIHLNSTSIESHNGDDATKDNLPFLRKESRLKLLLYCQSICFIPFLLPVTFSYEVESKIFRTVAAIYTAVVVARSTGPNKPNCEFRVRRRSIFAATAWKRAKTSPRTLAITDLAASP